MMALEHGSLAMMQPGTASPQALGTSSVMGADTAQYRTVVTQALAPSAQKV